MGWGLCAAWGVTEPQDSEVSVFLSFFCRLLRRQRELGDHFRKWLRDFQGRDTEKGPWSDGQTIATPGVTSLEFLSCWFCDLGREALGDGPLGLWCVFILTGTCWVAFAVAAFSWYSRFWGLFLESELSLAGVADLEGVFQVAFGLLVIETEPAWVAGSLPERFGPVPTLPGPGLFFVCFILVVQRAGMLVPWPRIEPTPPAVKSWSLNHWTARKSQGWTLDAAKAPVTWPHPPGQPLSLPQGTRVCLPLHPPPISLARILLLSQTFRLP